VLTIGYVSSLMVNGAIEAVEERLRDAEQWLDPAARPAGEMVVVDDEELRTLPTAIAMYRAGTALVRGDVAGTMTHARRALDLADEDDHLARGARRTPGARVLGEREPDRGEPAVRRRHGQSGAGRVPLRRARRIHRVADMRISQGRLREAMSIFERGVHRAEQSQPVLRGAADMHVGLSQLLRERDDLDGARQHLQASTALGEHAGLLQNPYRWRVAMGGCGRPRATWSAHES
jgi:LuxR family maltose regulon positive regulatory protein